MEKKRVDKNPDLIKDESVSDKKPDPIGTEFYIFVNEIFQT